MVKDISGPIQYVLKEGSKSFRTSLHMIKTRFVMGEKVVPLCHKEIL